MNDQPGPAEFIQANRILKVASRLGEDELLPERATIREGVSSFFEIDLAVRAKREEVKPEELIGSLVDVSIEVSEGQDGDDAVRRPFNGLVVALEEGPPVTRGLRAYSLRIVPQMWLLSQRSDCRIWMDRTSIDIVEELFSEHGLPAPDVSGVVQAPPAQHYSVQWNETDLAYLTRRFEEDGLFYWFSHEEGAHRLHVADSASGWLGPSASAQGEARVRLAQGSSDRNHITEWKRRYAFTPGSRAGADWNFETPKIVPGTTTPSLVQMPGSAKLELYEYPARIDSVEAAERAEKLRVQSNEADHDHVFGEATSRVIEVGRRFTPYEVPHPDRQYEEHVLVSAQYEVVDRSYETVSSEPEYRVRFEAVPSRIPMTPHRVTKRPRIEGTQVAIVAGPQGEEIHPDQYGRVKLWFPWDRRASKDGSDTCWVRVGQNWAGSTWGGQVIPRIGMEVMVAFIDGDPDRPLITGIVPNPDNAVPYDLPASKTKSVFRTNTHKGQGFNELTFEDESGSEEVYIHAQKDMNMHVLNDISKRVQNDQHEFVGRDKTIQVAGDHEEVIAGNVSIAVGKNNLGEYLLSRTNNLFKSLGGLMEKMHIPDPLNLAKGNFQIFIEKNKSEIVNGGSSEVVGVVKSTVVGNVQQTTVGRKKSLIVRGDYHEDIGRNRKLYVGDEFLLKVGRDASIRIKDGVISLKARRIVMEADSIDEN